MGNNLERVDVMVDIETLGKKSNSTVFQIAAMSFNLTTGEKGSVFNEIADIEKNERLTVDGSTLKWWLNTDKELLTTLLNKGNHSSKEVLTSFHEWLTGLSDNMKNVYLWGNGIIFDNKMIQHQFESIDLDYPIYYRNDRDVRTLLEIASLKTGITEDEIKQYYKDDSLTYHNAIDDVMYQINLVAGCHNLIVY